MMCSSTDDRASGSKSDGGTRAAGWRAGEGQKMEIVALILGGIFVAGVITGYAIRSLKSRLRRRRFGA